MHIPKRYLLSVAVCMMMRSICGLKQGIMPAGLRVKYTALLKQKKGVSFLRSRFQIKQGMATKKWLNIGMDGEKKELFRNING